MRVELDAGDDPAAGAQVAMQGRVDLLRVQDLELERNRQPVLGTARAEADERLAGNEAAADDGSLQAVEVGAPGRVALGSPGGKTTSSTVGAGRALRADADADDVRGPGRGSAGGVRVVQGRVLRPGADACCPAAVEALMFVSQPAPSQRRPPAAASKLRV